MADVVAATSVMFPEIVRIVLVGGAIGGIGQVAARIGLREMSQGSGAVKTTFAYDGGPDGGTRTPVSFSQFLWMLLGGIFLGIAGALGVVGILALVKVFEADLVEASSDQGRLVYLKMELFGVAVVGGFVARLILPLLGESIRQRIAHTENRISITETELRKQSSINEEQMRTINAFAQKNDELSHQLEGIKDELDQTKDLLLIETAVTALGSTSIDRRQKGMQDIGILLSKYPKNRKITIVAARYHTERVKGETLPPQHDVAIDILTRFLSYSDIESNDFADVELNRACYYVELMDLCTDSKDKERYRRLAMDDLKDSIARKAENRSYAADDPDLKSLRRFEEFQQLVNKTSWLE